VDVVTANFDNSTLALMAGNGDGTLQAAPIWPATAYPVYSGASEIVTGDFNEDGKPDFVVGELTALHVLLGQGNATLKLGATITEFTPFFGGVATADFDQDGHLDLAIGISSGPRNQEVYLGKGDGTFANAPWTTDPAWARQLIAVEITGD